MAGLLCQVAMVGWVVLVQRRASQVLTGVPPVSDRRAVVVLAARLRSLLAGRLNQAVVWVADQVVLLAAATADSVQALEVEAQAARLREGRRPLLAVHRLPVLGSAHPCLVEARMAVVRIWVAADHLDEVAQ